MSAPRSELRGAALLVLVGAAALLVAGAGDWVSGVVQAPPPLPSQDVAADAPGPVRALGLVVLAGLPALAATRRTGRVVVGALLVAAGLAALAVSVGVLVSPADALPGDATGASPSVRPLLAAAGAVVTVLAGLVVAVRGRRWPALGRRYEPPSGQPRRTSDDVPALWDALDRGEDPTREQRPDRS